jgi:hypothetical protein
MALEGSINDEPEVDIDSAAEDLLKRWTTKAASADTSKEPAAEEVEEEDHEEEDEGREDDGEKEGEDKPQRQVADDEHEVIVSVDGTEHRVPVKDLKRLFGQEAALTQKSQAVAEAHTQAQAMAERHVVALQTMIGKAEDRLKPYEQVDWALAAAKLPAEEYQQLKTAHEVLSTDVKFLKEELDGKVSEHREKQIEAGKQAAVECLKALTDPEHKAHIEGFNEETYTSIRDYALSVGVPQQLIDHTYDPVAIKLIHKAMLFDKAQKTAIKKLTNAPKNVNKTPTNDGTPGKGSARSAMAKLDQSGDLDDAAEALLARWS